MICDMNKIFNGTAECLTSKEPVKTSDIYRTITLLLENILQINVNCKQQTLGSPKNHQKLM